MNSIIQSAPSTTSETTAYRRLQALLGYFAPRRIQHRDQQRSVAECKKSVSKKVYRK